MISFPKVIKLTRLACPNERIRWGKRLKHTIGGRGRSKTSKFDRKFKNNPRLKKSYPILKKSVQHPGRSLYQSCVSYVHTQVSLTHANPPHPIPTGKKVAWGLWGAPHSTKPCVGSPTPAPYKVYITFSTPRNPHPFWCNFLFLEEKAFFNSNFFFTLRLCLFSSYYGRRMKEIS